MQAQMSNLPCDAQCYCQTSTKSAPKAGSRLKQSGRKGQGKDVRNLTETGELGSGREDHPAEGVTWKEANEYCAARDQLLPTEAQWEKTARGGCERGDSERCEESELLPYPWGSDTPTCALANHQLSTSSSIFVSFRHSEEHPIGQARAVRTPTSGWQRVGVCGRCVAPETYADRAKKSTSQLILNPQGPTPQADSCLKQREVAGTPSPRTCVRQSIS